MRLFQRYTGLLSSKVDKNTVLFQYHTNLKDSSPVVFRVFAELELSPHPQHTIPEYKIEKYHLIMCLGQRSFGSKVLLNMASSLL